MPIAKDHMKRWVQLSRLGQLKRARIIALNVVLDHTVSIETRQIATRAHNEMNALDEAYRKEMNVKEGTKE